MKLGAVLYEATIERAIRFEGIGLHSGRPVCLFLDPAEGGGRVFVTEKGTEIPASVDAVDSAARATILGVEGDRVATVEHLLAALSMAGIDHARIRIDGPEVPAFDGSAAPILEWLLGAGLVSLGEKRNPIVLSRPIEIQDDDCSIRAVPAETFGIDYEIDFPQPAIGYERFNEDIVDALVFGAEIAPARTFALMAEVEALRKAGLGLGGSLENTIVVDEAGVMNEGGLRMQGEFVRHKVLDLIGDLSLLGAPLHAKVSVSKGGHRLHHELVRAIVAQQGGGARAGG